MKKLTLFFMSFLLVTLSPFLCAQEDDLSDEELEAIAQREMLEFMITYAPIRFDNNLQLGEKLVYKSKIDETNISTIEVVKDTTNAFWVKEEFEGNIVFQLISRESGELLDIKGYDDKGNFNHPTMLSEQEKEIVISKRNEKIIQMDEKQFFVLSDRNEQISIGRSIIPCNVIETVNNELSNDIFTSENIPKMLPFAFGLEMSLTCNLFHQNHFGLVSSYFIELVYFEE